jgi:Protein of unknown function (DUF1566)
MPSRVALRFGRWTAVQSWGNFLAFAFLCAPFCQGADLLIHTDVECRLSVDGAPQGTLKTGDGLRLNLASGEHQLEATPLDGKSTWRKTIQVAAAENQTLDIPMREVISAQASDDRGYWIDSETQLMWTAADNGSGVSLSQAVRYCRRLTLSGFEDWTLPSIDDLQRLFGGPDSRTGYRIKGPIKLSGWQWSSTPGTQAGEGWALDFGDGARASVAAGDSGLNRALCVRHPAK